MKASTDCGRCPLFLVCPLKRDPRRRPIEEDGLGLCPKLQRMSEIKCRDCLFLNPIGTRLGTVIYECMALNGSMKKGGGLPERAPKFCPIKEAKRKGL